MTRCWSCGVELKQRREGGYRITCARRECQRKRNNFVDNHRRQSYRADLRAMPFDYEGTKRRQVQRALEAGELSFAEIAAEFGCGVNFVKQVNGTRRSA
jgi:hypothetical protein